MTAAVAGTLRRAKAIFVAGNPSVINSVEIAAMELGNWRGLEEPAMVALRAAAAKVEGHNWQKLAFDGAIAAAEAIP